MSKLLRFNCHKCKCLVTMKQCDEKKNTYLCPYCYTEQYFDKGIVRKRKSESE